MSFFPSLRPLLVVDLLIEVSLVRWICPLMRAIRLSAATLARRKGIGKRHLRCRPHLRGRRLRRHDTRRWSSCRRRWLVHGIQNRQ